MIGRNDTCWCGSDKKWKKCHFPDRGPVNEEEELRKEYFKKYGILIKTQREIDGIRRAGHLAAQILDATCSKAIEGVTTNELNDFAHSMHLENKARPAPLHYDEPPFPKSICTSLNNVICHGIPDDKPLKNGDILNIDVTPMLGDYYGDCSKMVMVGSVSDEKKHVCWVAYESLMRAVAILKPGEPVCSIGEAIEDFATSHGCSVVHQFIGHGVGVGFHEPPQIFHYRNRNKTPLAPGMTFTIEPMINLGKPEAVIDPIDKWTARTVDGKSSAQWEHTLVITKDGAEILTPWSLPSFD